MSGRTLRFSAGIHIITGIHFSLIVCIALLNVRVGYIRVNLFVYAIALSVLVLKLIRVKCVCAVRMVECMLGWRYIFSTLN